MNSYLEPAPIYNVDLLYRSAPSVNKAHLLAHLRQHCPGIEPLDGSEYGDSLAFVHTRHVVSYRDGAIPAQAFMSIAEEPPDSRRLASAIQQSWRLGNAAGVVDSCSHSIVVTDLMANGLDYQLRFDLFQRVLNAFMAAAPCDAIHWAHAEQVIAADDFISAQKGSLSDMLSAGPINVRFFNVENSGGDLLMDTRGLSAFGLPDLQCHFHELDPREVAVVLYNTALYLYEAGDVIDDGHTVDGVAADSKWLCQHEESLAGPTRVVLDMNPGPPFAAGGR